MATYAVNGDTLTGIADAIRAKTGSDEQMPIAAMAAAIEGIPAGGGERDTLVVEYDLIEDYTSTSNTAIAVFDSVEVGAFFERHHGRRGSTDKVGSVSLYSLVMESDVAQTSDNVAGYKYGLYVSKYANNATAAYNTGGVLCRNDSFFSISTGYGIKLIPALDSSCANPSGWVLNLNAQCGNGNFRRVVSAGHYKFTITHVSEY